MRHFSFFALLLFSPVALHAQAFSALSQDVRQYVSVSEPVVALVNVRVVDGTGAPAAESRTIVIESGRIAAVGPASQVAVPAGARTMDLAGHTVLPGFVGLHQHTHLSTRGRQVQLNFSAPRLYLANGITTMRTAGGISPYSELNLRREIERGETPGPRMQSTGPRLSAPGGSLNMVHLTGPDHARRVVGYWADEGVEWFKAYTDISRANLRAAIEEAHKRGRKVTAHLCSVTFREAAEMGIDNLEHSLFASSDFVPGKVPDKCPGGLRNSWLNVATDSPEMQQLIRDLVARKVAITTTPAVFESSIPGRPPLEHRVLAALAPDVRQEYLDARSEAAPRGEESAGLEALRRAQAFERAFVEAGGLLGAGADPTGGGIAVQGFADQRNYELLVEGGFAAVEAVRIMSANGAKVLGMDDRLGTIAPGKLADLLVVKGDPVTRPSEIRQLSIVFKEGVGYDPVRLLASVKGIVGTR